MPKTSRRDFGVCCGNCLSASSDVSPSASSWTLNTIYLKPMDGSLIVLDFTAAQGAEGESYRAAPTLRACGNRAASVNERSRCRIS